MLTVPGITSPLLKIFEGFRIAQLSDIHIGPFTTANYIRRCVTITNGLQPDLVVLTGDYISWDPEAQGEVVGVLARLRAPQGVFGCLGNHEQEGKIEESTETDCQFFLVARARAAHIVPETALSACSQLPLGRVTTSW